MEPKRNCREDSPVRDGNSLELPQTREERWI